MFKKQVFEVILVECKGSVFWPLKKVSSHSANKHASKCEKFCMELDRKYVRCMNYCFFSTFTDMGDCGNLWDGLVN
jgi:hypothetical protein